MFQRLTAAVADMQNVHSQVLNREENPIHMWPPAMQQLANLEREYSVLWS